VTQDTAGSGYPPEKAKQLLAENMYLPGMTYGKGETPQYGGTAFFSNKAELPNDDPTTTTSITSINVLGPLFGNGGLVGVKRENNVEPSPEFAESWTVSEDYKVWTFKLRQGVKWHDGSVLTAEEVKFAMDLSLFPPRGRRVSTGLSNALPGIVDIKAPDASTVVLTFKSSSPHLLETFANETNPIIHKKSLMEKELEKGNVNAGLAPLGWVQLGPYKYESYVRGGNFKVVRFDQYWEKDSAGRALPYLDSVVNTPIPDRAVALGAFRAGRLDAMSRGVGTNLDPQEVQLAKRTFGDKVWFHRYPYLAYGIQMNVLKPPFNDIRARKAVNLYMDRNEGAQKMHGGFAFSSGFLSPASPWHSFQYEKWPGFNPATKVEDQAEAKRLMKEANLAGAATPITCRQDYLFMCEFADSVLTELGFVAEIKLMDVNAQADASRTLQYITQTAGPCNDLRPAQCMEAYTTTATPNRYNDPKIDEWQNIILTSTDPAVRKKALWEAEKYFLLDMAYNAPFLREEVVAPYRTYLKGSVVPGARAHDNSDRSTDWIDKSLK
jgi:ABC-type transport system substrate-binding protein